MKNGYLFLILILLLGSISTGAFSKTYYVSKTGSDSNIGTTTTLPLLNIKTALTKSVSGDKVYVAPGLYQEGQTINIKNGVSLYGGFKIQKTISSDEPSTSILTIIDGNKSYQCIKNSGYIDNVNIRNGRSSSSFGGGVYNQYGTINNCTIADCSFTVYSSTYGSGVYNYNGTVKNCTITGNSAYSGGGIYNHYGTVLNCTLEKNSADNSGGGIYNYFGSVSNCSISATYGDGLYNYYGSVSNCSVSAAYGNGLYNYYGTITKCSLDKNNKGLANNNGNVSQVIIQGCSDLALNNIKGTVSDSIIKNNNNTKRFTFCIDNSGTIDNCRIVKNSSNDNGGVLYNHSGVITNSIIAENNTLGQASAVYNKGIVSNCLISGNYSESNGGGVHNVKGKVVNCTIVNNRALIEGGGIFNEEGTVTNSIIWRNYPGDVTNSLIGQTIGKISYSCFGEADNTTDSNIRANPLFYDTQDTDTLVWDLRLKSGSPCTDAGNKNAEGRPSVDIAGNPRPGSDGKVCMGAYESPDANIPGIPAPPAVIYVSQNGTDTTGADWIHAFRTITKAVSVTLKSDEISEIRAAGNVYMEGHTIIIPGNLNLTGGWSGNPGEPDKKNTSEYKTIIDGEEKYPGVSNYGMLDGLYIQNALSENINWLGFRRAGGLYNHGVVINCSIAMNSAPSNGWYSGVSNYGRLINSDVTDNKEASADTVANYGTISGGNVSRNNSGGIDNFPTGVIMDCTVDDNLVFGIYNFIGKVSGCSITNNKGGGIVNAGNYAGDLTEYAYTSNCIIKGNSGFANYGGGMINVYGYVTDCIITDNYGDSGGGVYNENGRISNCIVERNYAKGMGAGINNYEKGEIVNSKICGNIAGDTKNGTAAGVFNGSTSSIINSIIVGNSSSGEGCGIFNYGSVVNCTIAGNSSSLSNGSGVYNFAENGITNSIIQKNYPGDYSNYGSGSISYSCFREADETSGTISADPMFIDTSSTDTLAWDLRLTPASPCIDSGTTVSIVQDITGAARPLGNGFDMGAYEYNSFGDVTMDGITNYQDIQKISDYLCGRSELSCLQKANADANPDGKIDICDIVILSNYISQKRKR